MKPTTLLLAASLLGNLALIAFIATRAKPSPTPQAPVSAPVTAESDAIRKADALRAALVSGDAAALAAAGVSPEIARELMIGRTFARMAEKIHAARAGRPATDEWWKGRSGLPSPAAREQQLVARRELSDALIAAFGDDLGLAGSDQSQYAFLPAGKRDALRRIIQDYDEMMAKFSAGGVQLASDREKLKLLRSERDRDIAALLTPEEQLAYEMRSSISGNIVKNRYGDAIESEAEFQKIFALQKEFDEKFSREALSGRISPEVLRARAEAERELDAKIRAAVGEDRYAALRRAADPDVRTIDALASRLNLPPTTTDSVLASRDTYSATSQQISGNTSLSLPERRAQIQALATQAKTELARTLGEEAAEAYAQRSPWLSMLQNGMAYSTTPPDNLPGTIFPGGGQSVYPISPAGAGAVAGQRQFVFNTATVDAPIAGGAIIGGGLATGGDVRVMTFSPATVTDAAPAAGAIVRPAPGTAPVVTPAPDPTAPTPRR